MTPGFVHLEVHSEYSLADSIVKMKPLASAVAARGMAAVAVTDIGNLFGLIKFYRACLGAGVKPLVGVEVRYAVGDNVARVSLLAMNDGGYANLLKLISCAYVHEGDVIEQPGTRYSLVTKEQIEAFSQGVMMLLGGPEGELALCRDQATGQAAIQRWATTFDGRLYLTLQRFGRSDDEVRLRQHLAVAEALELPVVATNRVCFLDVDDFEAHETRVCIHQGRVLNDPRRPRAYADQQYLKSAEEMAALFADLPEALANSVEIARRCNVQLKLGSYYLPNYPVASHETLESHLKDQAHAGLRARLAESEANPAVTLTATLEEYTQRLDYELDVINQMGFPGYFLIVMEFIQWARDNDIPVGPGRGSGAGSLVAYALGITDLDPLIYDLLFERFLNPERVSMPDFDVDFCMEGRDKVIHHVSERYGQDAVSQIITFGTMAAKAVVRDVARVQGKPYGLADKLSKLIPFEVGMTLTKAVEEAEELRTFIDENDEVVEIMDMAYKLEGVVRNVGKHAGGVVIAPSALTDFVPLYAEESGGGLVSQFDKDDVESAGLVKFDFLGLKTLTIIDWAVKAINEAGATPEPLDIKHIKLDDPATFAMLKRAESVAIFQLESRGMRDLIRRLLPDSIEDIIALVALFRPGPLQSGAVDDYINRKHGREPVTFPHPSLSEALSSTYGVVLYQEQVMQIAQVLAGFTLGQADLLRRAMGKKKPEEMAKVREQFLTGTGERGVDAKLAGEIFDLMEKFAGYAFNKSHSATYAVVSYQTAWLKCHFPAFFMAANLSAEMQNIDKIVGLVDECHRLELTLVPPSVNRSAYRFTVDGNDVVYGLGAVRGVGEGPVESIVDARQAGGQFSDLHDFCTRIDSRRANKRVVEALIRSGAMDELAPEEIRTQGTNAVRAWLLDESPRAIQGAEQNSRDAEIGMVDLFGGVGTQAVVPPIAAIAPLSDQVCLQGEKDTLGLYLSGHPIDEHLPELRQICPIRLVELNAGQKKQLVAGLVNSTRTMRNRRGGTIGFVVLDDKSARVEATLFANVFEAHRHKISEDALIVLEGDAQVDEFNGAGSVKLKVDAVYTLEEARAKFLRGVEINIPQPATTELSVRLQTILTPHRAGEAGCGVALRYAAPEAEARIRLGEAWRVHPCDDLLNALRDEFGREHVTLAYGNGTV